MTTPFRLPNPPVEPAPAPVPWPGPTHPTPTHPDPPPRPTRNRLRIGQPPRLPRRQRVARTLNQAARYLAAYAIVGWACYWLADVHLCLPGIAIAAMLCNPRRPKTSRVAPAVGRAVPATRAWPWSAISAASAICSARSGARPARRPLPLPDRRVPVATSGG